MNGVRRAGRPSCVKGAIRHTSPTRFAMFPHSDSTHALRRPTSGAPVKYSGSRSSRSRPRPVQGGSPHPARYLVEQLSEVRRQSEQRGAGRIRARDADRAQYRVYRSRYAVASGAYDRWCGPLARTPQSLHRHRSCRCRTSGTAQTGNCVRRTRKLACSSRPSLNVTPPYSAPSIPK